MEETPTPPTPQTYGHQVTAEGGLIVILIITVLLVLGAGYFIGFINDSLGPGWPCLACAGVIALVWFGWTWAYPERRKLRGLPPLW